MNSMLKNLLIQLDGTIDSIGEVMHHHKEQNLQFKKQHDQLRKEHWSQEKELNILREQADAMTSVYEENARFRAIQNDLRERLEFILTHTKVLGESLRQ